MEEEADAVSASRANGESVDDGINEHGGDDDIVMMGDSSCFILFLCCMIMADLKGSL
jgi:hypothetical protein